jgi:uncharacterized protein
MKLHRWPGLLASAAGALGVAAVALGLVLAIGDPAVAAAEVPVPKLNARVTDLTSTLNPSQLQALESRLAAFEQKKGSQIVVLMLPSTKPETIEQYSIRVAEAWKIGRSRVDDGVILVIAKDDHKLRIEVGRGLEGAVPDVVAKRVIREVIAPHFLDGDFNGGIAEGTATLMRLIEGEALPAPNREAAGASSGSDLEGLLAPLLVASVFLGAILSKLFGRMIGAAVTAGIVGAAAWAVIGAVLAAVLAAIVAFFVALVLGAGGLSRAGWGSGGWGSGGWTGGGGGFSGGGGDFGGGGASGNW